MKTLLYVLLALVVLLVAAVLVVPGFIDWNSYKDEIAARAERALGRELDIAGNVRLSMLPRPTFSVEQVTVANAAGGEAAEMVSLRALNMEIRVAPLLQGRVRVRQVSLLEPRFTIERLSDGSWNWRRRIEAATADDGSGGFGGLGEAIRLDDLRIVDGTVVYRDLARGTEARLSDLDARLSADTLGGPFDGAGAFTYLGRRGDFEISLGRLAGGGAVPLNVQLSIRDAAARAELNGALAPRPSPDEPLVSGDLELSGEDLRQVLTAVGADPGAAPQLAQSFRGGGVLEVRDARAALTDLSLKLGETSADGRLDVGFGETPTAALDLTVQRLNLDRLLAMERPADDAGGEGGRGLQGFALPDGVRAELNLDIGAVVYRKQVVRQTRINAVLADGTLTLNQAMALFPGGSDAALFGTLTGNGGKPRFDGRVEAASDNLRALFDWWGVELDAVPRDRLRRMSLLADIGLSGRQLTVTNVDLDVDTTTIRGALAVALGRSRPGLGIGIRVDKLNLDAYRPRETSPNGTGLGVASLLPVLDRFDANFDLRAGQVVYDGRTLEDVRFDATLNKGTVNVREARVGAIAGSRIVIGGTIAGFVAGAPTFDTSLDVTVAEPVRFARVFGADEAMPAGLGTLTLTGKLSGTPEKIDVDATLAALDGTVSATGAVRPLTGPPEAALEVRVEHEDLAALLRRIPEGPRLGKTIGGLDLSAQLNATPLRLELADLAGQLGPVKLSGTLDAAFDGPRPRIRASLDADELPIHAFGAATPVVAERSGAPDGADGARWSDAPLDLGVLRGYDGELTLRANTLAFDPDTAMTDAHVRASLEDGVLDVGRFGGGMLGGTLDVVGTIDARDEPTVGVKLKAENLESARLLSGIFQNGRIAGPLNVSADLTGQGRSERALVQSLAGEGSLDGSLSLKGAGKEQTGRMLLDMLGARIQALQGVADTVTLLQDAFGGQAAELTSSFTVERGVVRTTDATLRGKGALARLRGTADLPNWRTDAEIGLHRGGAAEGEAFMTTVLRGPLNQPNVSIRGGPFRQRGDDERTGTEPSDPTASRPPSEDQTDTRADGAEDTTADQDASQAGARSGEAADPKARQQAAPDNAVPDPQVPKGKRPTAEDIIRDLLGNGDEP